jgi:T5SS/PEP-CTERM-associated repeat protein
MSTIAQSSGSTGLAIVTGTGSAWNTNSIMVGMMGAGMLRVENGGKVINTGGGYLGNYAGSTGTAVITGAGSVWANTGVVSLVQPGTGSLIVGNGGQVTGTSLSINSASAASLHVSGSGMLVLGTTGTAGSIANSGNVSLYADAFLAAGTYSPITELKGRAMAWTGTGSYNAYGGTWDSTAHTFAVASAATAASGTSSTLTTGERLLITDSGTGHRVGASFGTVTAGTNFSAVPMGGTDLIGLPTDQCVLSAWNFTTNFAGDQALLSFDVGAGQSYDMSVWHYNGTAWAPFAAPDLTYGEDGIADFAVTSFVGGYALTAAAHNGDANCDGAVNVIDLGVLAKYYGTDAGATWAMGDFSGDGRVDVVDLGVLAKNYDWSGASAGAVPEPCSVALLALGAFGLLRRRGR